MALLSIKRVAVSVILGLVTFAAFHLTSTGQPSFRIEYHANKSVNAEIFFDTGAGFNAEESFRQTSVPTNTWMEIVFPLPKSIIKRLRFDPADSSGSLSIRNIRIVDPLGLEIMRISPETFHPEKEIQSLAVNGRSLEIVTLPEAEDPILSISLDSKLDLRGGGYAFSKYAFFLLVWVSVWLLLGAAVVHFKLFSLLSTLLTQAPGSSEYLSEIDGLRAIAVLAVLLFHLDIAYVPGGYLGVDIFFVISGFLITRLIVNEFRETGRFRFGNFYLRRARRLFPAFFVTIVISLIGATFLFEPNDLERTGGAALHAIASIANFFFWSEAGYFDADSSVKPLLHTWSLSVEEQFYLLWPSVLVCLMITKIRWAPVLVVLLLCAASLYWRFSFADGEIALFANLSRSVPEWLTLERWFSDGRATIFFSSSF